MRFQCPFCQGVVAVANTDMGTDCQCGHCGEVVSVPTSRVATGSVISDFIILEELGRGGMGVVYLTHQITLDRPSALKILAGAYANDPEFVVDFIKEARAAAKLNHPHIVQAYAVGEDEGIYFFAMEHIDGETMKDYMKREGVVSIEFALEVIQQIGEALDYAWKEQRLVHRDIKPDNIMLTRKGRAKLADLGLARIAGDIDDADSDEVMGTPQYISPEHLTGAEMDVRSDIYSLGATLFHLITGRFAFEGRTATDIARKHLETPLQSPREVNPAIPESVSRIIIKMMAKNANERYQSAEDLVEDIRLARQGKAPSSSTGAVKKQGKGGKQFSIKKGGGTKTGTFQAASSSSGKSKTISTTSTGIRKSPLSSTGSHPQMDKAQAKLEKERKAKNQLIVMVVIVFCVLLAGGGFLVWTLTKDKGNDKTPTKKPNGTQTNVSQPPVNGENPPPVESAYIKSANELLVFAKSNPGKDKEIHSKFKTFLDQATKLTTNSENEKKAELMAVYTPLDEKIKKIEKEEELLAIAKKREEEAKQKAAEALKKKEEAERLAREKRKKDLEDRIKQVELAKLQKNKERLDEYIKTQEDNKNRARYLSLYYSTQQKFTEAKKAISPSLNEASKVTDDLYKQKAQEITDWGKMMDKHIDIAAKTWKTISNSGDKLKGIQIEPRPGTLGTITNIKDGVVTVKTFDGKDLSHPFLSLRFRDFKKLVLKADKLLPDESNPAFHFLFSAGFFELAQSVVSEDWKAEFEASSQAYLVKELSDIEGLNNEAEIKNKKRELYHRAGKAAYIKALKAMQQE